MAQHRNPDSPFSRRPCKSGRRLRFEACESRLTLDGAGFESIPVPDFFEPTDITTGGITFSLNPSPTVTFRFDQGFDVTSLSQFTKGSLPTGILNTGPRNGVPSTDATLRFFLGNTTSALSNSSDGFYQDASHLWQIPVLEPIRRLPPATEPSPEIAAEVADAGETIAIAGLFDRISDTGFNRDTPARIDPPAKQPPANNSSQVIFASNTQPTEAFTAERIQETSSNQTRAWAFEVASLDSLQEPVSLRMAGPQNASQGASPATHSPPTPPAEKGRDASPITTSAGIIQAISDESNAEPLLLAADSNQSDEPPESIPQDAAFAAFTREDQDESTSHHPIDHRYGLAASLLAILIIDRVFPAESKGSPS